MHVGNTMKELLMLLNQNESMSIWYDHIGIGCEFLTQLEIVATTIS